MPNLTLPEIDEEIVRTIKTRAELTGQSIEAVAQQALKLGCLTYRAVWPPPILSGE